MEQEENEFKRLDYSEDDSKKIAAATKVIIDAILLNGFESKIAMSALLTTLGHFLLSGNASPDLVKAVLDYTLKQYTIHFEHKKSL